MFSFILSLHVLLFAELTQHRENTF